MRNPQRTESFVGKIALVTGTTSGIALPIDGSWTAE